MSSSSARISTNRFARATPAAEESSVPRGTVRRPWTPLVWTRWVVETVPDALLYRRPGPPGPQSRPPMGVAAHALERRLDSLLEHLACGSGHDVEAQGLLVVAAGREVPWTRLDLPAGAPHGSGRREGVLRLRRGQTGQADFGSQHPLFVRRHAAPGNAPRAPAPQAVGRRTRGPTALPPGGMPRSGSRCPDRRRPIPGREAPPRTRPRRRAAGASTRRVRAGRDRT